MAILSTPLLFSRFTRVGKTDQKMTDRILSEEENLAIGPCDFGVPQ